MNKIKIFRKKNNMSQEKLAEIMGIKQNTISQWENEKRMPTLIQALKLANILETTVDNLYKK